MKLINILLKNITPEDWPEKYPFAVQDNSTGNVYFYDEKPGVNNRDQCFLLYNIKEQYQRYDLEVLIDKAKAQLKASQKKLKQSFN